MSTTHFVSPPPFRKMRLLLVVFEGVLKLKKGSITCFAGAFAESNSIKEAHSTAPTAMPLPYLLSIESAENSRELFPTTSLFLVHFAKNLLCLISADHVTCRSRRLFEIAVFEIHLISNFPPVPETLFSFLVLWT